MESLLSPHIFNFVSPAMVVGYVMAFRAWSRFADRREQQGYEVRQVRALREMETAFVAKALLTPNEVEFYGRLKRAAAALSLEVVPQVSMGALLDVNLPQDHPMYWAMRKQFSQKIIDFVVYKQGNLEVLSIVELDDRTHDKEKDRARDAMMAKAGFTTVRWESKAKPSVSEIVRKFESMLATVS